MVIGLDDFIGELAAGIEEIDKADLGLLRDLAHRLGVEGEVGILLLAVRQIESG